jgi:predicted MFS family arabinose efflux permease
LALALAIQNLAWGVFAIVAGGLTDRFGSAKVMLSAIVLYALGMFTMAYSTSEIAIISTAGLLVGAGVAGTSFGVVLPVIARAVPEAKRAQALGIGTAAGSFGQFLIVPLMQIVVDTVGWFQALQFLGLSALAMAAFALPLARYEQTGAGANTNDVQQSLWQIASRALRVRSYVLLITGFFVCGFHVAFITVHMPGYVVDLGFDAKIGAWSISLIGLCNVVGAYSAGMLSNRYAMRKLLTFIYLGRVVAIGAFLILPPSIPSILLFSASMGFLWLATVPPTSGLVALFFGTRYMTFLYGIVFFSHQLGSFSGIWLGGKLYEIYGNYDGIWYTGMALGVIAALLHWPIQERPYTEQLAAA